MIVKRMMAGLKRQDWAMVAIEFALVVIGVLLAFQITEWANEREAAHEREEASERLLLEAEQTVAYVKLGLSAQKQSTADLNYALDQVRQGAWQTADQGRMVRGLSTVTVALPLAPPSAVYDDLIASGSFGKFGDAKLRSAIAKYRATLNFHAVVIANFLQKQPNLEEHEAFRYAFSPIGRQRVRLDVDFPALANDTLLQEKLALLADSQRVRFLITERALKGVTRMCLELGRYVGRPCNLDLPPPTFD